jgi:hypothetical protein
VAVGVFVVDTVWVNVAFIVIVGVFVVVGVGNGVGGGVFSSVL